MVIYNINHGIGWASSGVEYAQVYRASIFRKLGRTSKFVFTDFFNQDNIADLTRNIGFRDDEVIWLYTYFTDLKISPSNYTLKQLEAEFVGQVSRVETVADNPKVIRFFFDDKKQFITAYLCKEGSDCVRAVEYVSQGCLARKDYYSYTKMFSEYYTPRDNQAYLYQRRFFNEDGSIAYDELVDGKKSVFRFPDAVLLSKEELVSYFIKKLSLTAQDCLIIDRSTDIGQSIFENRGPAKVGVVVHAEHFSPNHVREKTILWNNYYEYQFSNADKVDFFITSTERQKEIMEKQFEQYSKHRPRVVAIPVGSIDQLNYPTEKRKPYSMITASRLAGEKHIDWLIKAVVEAKKTLPQLTFDIYGEGGERDKLEKLIVDNQASDYIQLKGHHHLQEIYKQYELYLAGSTSEGFGLTLLEAIGSGLAMIGLDVRYGNQTFIKDRENGFLLPVVENEPEQTDLNQFVTAILDLFEERESLEKKHAVSYEIAQAYLTTEIEKKWQNVLQEFDVE